VVARAYVKAQLREEVHTQMRLAEQTDRADHPNGMDAPIEIAKRDDRSA